MSDTLDDIDRLIRPGERVVDTLAGATSLCRDEALCIFGRWVVYLLPDHRYVVGRLRDIGPHSAWGSWLPVCWYENRALSPVHLPNIAYGTYL